MLIYARPSVKEARLRMPRRSTRPSAAEILLMTILLIAAAPAGAAAAPDGEREMVDILRLAGGIGPRKTGTEADRRAIDYVRGAMEAAGLRVDLQEVKVLLDPDSERAVGSWNVVGTLEGGSPDTILVAAHHDSRNTLVPGANDDASGLAVLLETARAVATRRRRCSYLFISFCAEEEGLLGSTYFARNADLSRLRAVVALELLGRGDLYVAPVPKPPPYWAQDALLRAGREAGVRGVVARPLWTLAARLAELSFTSDHQPFLERGVPAFLLAGTFSPWAYHTSEDGVLRIQKQALVRSARVLDRLLQDLESVPPPRGDDPHYLPLMAFGQGVLVPSRVLRGIDLAAALGVVLLVVSRLRSILSFKSVGEVFRVLIVTSVSTALGLSGLVASEALMERIHQDRFPWTAHQPLHVLQAIVLTLATGWLGLKLFRRIKPTVDPGPYLGAALLLPIGALAASLRLGWPEMGAIAAVPILSFLLSVLVESVGRKLALGLLGALPLFLVLTPGDYRAAVEIGGIEIPPAMLLGALFAAAFPFVLFLAHVACFQDCLHSAAWWWLSGPWVGGFFLLAWIALLAATALLPAYDMGHRQVVRLRQQVDLGPDRATLMIRSQDSLEGVRLRGLGGRVLEGAGVAERLILPFPAGRFGFGAEVSETPEGAERSVTCTARLKLPRPTDRLSWLFTSRSGFRVPDRDPAPRHSYSFVEVAPRVDPSRTFRLLLPASGDLSITVRADVAEDLLDVDPADGPRTFVHQGSILAFRPLISAGAAAPTAGAGAAPAD